MRTLYGPNLPQEPSPDVEMAVDELPVVEEIPFTTVTNKKNKGKERSYLLLTFLYLSRMCPHQQW